MELDDLKSRWKEHDKKLDASLRLNKRLLQESILSKAETALKRLSRLIWVELLLNLGASLMLGSFIAHHISEPRFWIPAAVLHLCSVVLIIASIRQLAAFARLDYGSPIILIQKQLETLRTERILTVKWTLLLSPLVLTPLFIVAMKGLFDVDVYATFSTSWLAANLLFGLLVIAAALWVSRQYALQIKRSSLLQRFLRDIGGQNLATAHVFLHSLSQFENDADKAA